MEYAAANRLIPLGTIHSYTYRKGVQEYDEVQSLADLATWDTLDRITGIANVVEVANGRKRCSDPVFHGPPNPVEVTVK